MELLKEIVQVLSKKKLKPVGTIQINNTDGNSYNQFYHAILQGDVTSDKDAIRYFFDEEVKSKKYLMFKSRFKKRLLNHLFFIQDSETISIKAREKLSAYRNVFLARILLTISANESAFALAKKSLPKIKKQEWLDLHLVALRILITEASLKSKLKKLNLLSEELLETSIKLISETKSYMLNEKCRYIYKNRNVLRKIDKVQLVKFMKEMDELASQEGTSFLTKWNYCLVYMEFLRRERHFVKLLCKVKEFESLFKKQPHFISKSNKQILSLFRMECYSQTNQFEKGEREILKIKELYPNGTLNWFNAQGQYFLLFMKQAKYDEAFAVWEETTQQKKFDSFPYRVQEKWRIWEAYLFLIFQAKSKLPKIMGLRKFRITRFLNELVQIQRDKEGANASIYVVAFLYYLWKKDYDAIIDRNQANIEYQKRYLKNNKRAKFFFGIMSIVVKVDFEKKVVASHINKAMDELCKNRNTENVNQAIEVIPFEKSFNLILDFL